MARGLVFAGLAQGGLVGSTHYHDSSLYGNHGTLTQMDPGTDWVFDPTLGRWISRVNLTTKTIVCPAIALQSVGTAACWFRGTNTPASFGKFWIIGSGELQLFRNDSDTSIAFSIGGSNRVFTTIDLWDNEWHHVVAQWATNWRRLVIDGVPGTPSGTSYTFPATWSNLYLGNQAAGDRTSGGELSDVAFFSRALSPAEIQQLADPSNVMLSGLILPPRRTLFSVSTLSIAEEYIYRKINYYRRLRSS